MPNRKKPQSRKNSRRPLSPTIWAAIIAGGFAIVTTLLTIGSDWLTTIRGLDPLVTPRPTWPPLPIIKEPLPSPSSQPPIRIDGIEVEGSVIYFPETMEAAVASTLAIGQQTPATSGTIYVSFDLTGLSAKEWVKIQNQLYFKVDKLEDLPSGPRQNLLVKRPEGVGGSGWNIDFDLFVHGPITAGDTLISPPSIKADFFTLQPGEKMSFRLKSKWEISPGNYTISLGLVYDYGGKTQSMWLEYPLKVISPANPVFWTYENGKWITSSP